MQQMVQYMYGVQLYVLPGNQLIINNMKKLLFLIAILVSGNGLLAQDVKFGIKTGLNFPSLQSKTAFSPAGDYKISAKFLLGVYSEIKMGKYTLQPGVMFSVKGNKAVQDSNTISYGSKVPYTIERNVNLSYLEVPVNLLYKQPVKIGTIYAGGGPYAALALSGRMRSINKRSTYMKRSSVEDVEFGSDPDQIKRTDFGANFLIGLKTKNGFDIGANYGLGLANISNNSSFKSSNRLIGLQIGYLF